MSEKEKTTIACVNGKGIIKKSFLCMITLLMIFSSALLTSCTKIRSSDEILAKNATALIEKAQVLNYIYWGRGIPKKEGGAVMTDERFCEADLSSLSQYGITDMQSLRDYTRSVYSENESDNIIRTYLERSSYTDSFDNMQYTEYYTRYLADGEGKLFVRDGIDNLMGDTIVEYKYSTIHMGERQKRTVVFTIDVYISTKDGKPGYTDTLALEMRLENGEYRLNTPIYCIYDEATAAEKQ